MVVQAKNNGRKGIIVAFKIMLPKTLNAVNITNVAISILYKFQHYKIWWRKNLCTSQDS